MAEFSSEKIAHLEMIQGVITRMAGESAKMKQFSLVAIGALGSTAAGTGAWGLALVAAFLTIVFWGLDAQYLAQERWFRDHYDKVRLSEAPVDFAMMPDKTIQKQHRAGDMMMRWSTLYLYGALVLICLAITLAVAP